MSAQASSRVWRQRTLNECTNENRGQEPCSDENLPITTGSLQRKSSMRQIYPYGDSSEDLPSSHESQSFYNALRCEEGSSNRGSLRLSDVCLPRMDAASQKTTTDPTKSPVLMNSVPQNRNVHIPTQLETIIEQKSISTLRQSATLSLRAKASVISQLSRRTPIQDLKAQAATRRKNSFSLNDLAALKYFTRFSRLFRSTASTSSNTSYGYSDDHLCYPNIPIVLLPTRAPTPEGLPTFNTPAAANYRLPAPPMRFRDLFHPSSSAAADERWQRQTVGLPRGVVMYENGIAIRGRFRPGLSGHTGVPLQRQLPPGYTLDILGHVPPPPRTSSNGRAIVVESGGRVGRPMVIENSAMHAGSPENSPVVPGPDFDRTGWCIRFLCCFPALNSSEESQQREPQLDPEMALVNSADSDAEVRRIIGGMSAGLRS